MTRNQIAFQRELNRLQKSITTLKRKGYTQNVDLPDMPKRVTSKAIEELKLQTGKHYTVRKPTLTEQPKSRSKTITTETKTQYIHKPRQAQTREEINAKRRSYYAQNRDKIISQHKKWRTENPDKVSASRKKYYEKNKQQISDKAKAKRRQAREDKSKPTTPKDQYYPKETPIENVSRETSTGHGDYDMIDWILVQIAEARSDVITNQPATAWVGQIPRSVRLDFLSQLTAKVESNRDSDQYYETLSGREDEISTSLYTISWDSKQEVVENSWAYLDQLFSPTGYIDTERAKEISEEGEAYNDENY